MPDATGAIVYEGPSQIDGSPIVCIVTGLVNKSHNKKTGPMVQAWIMRADQNPFSAVLDGTDVAVCGDCSKRGETYKARTCYVNVPKAPLNIYKTYARNGYDTLDPEKLRGKNLRIGAYGDPCAVPLSVWKNLLPYVNGHTGYTHQWRNPMFKDFSEFLMASADLAMDVRAASKLGWRSFYVEPKAGDPTGTVEGAMVCPASAERNLTTCNLCRGCNGTSGKNKRNIRIMEHK